MKVVLDQPVLEELRSELRGQVIGPADPDYEIARKVHNGMIDKRPAVIVRCAGVADVIAALEFGLGHDLPIEKSTRACYGIDATVRGASVSDPFRPAPGRVTRRRLRLRSGTGTVALGKARARWAYPSL